MVPSPPHTSGGVVVPIPQSEFVCVCVCMWRKGGILPPQGIWSFSNSWGESQFPNPGSVDVILLLSSLSMLFYFFPPSPCYSTSFLPLHVILLLSSLYFFPPSPCYSTSFLPLLLSSLSMLFLPLHVILLLSSLSLPLSLISSSFFVFLSFNPLPPSP